jgi:hypothetical protein
MNTFILRENVLTDNLLLIASENKIFKGGYKAIIKEYFYQNQWGDREEIKKFRKIDTLEKYLAKNYKDFEIENIYTH